MQLFLHHVALCAPLFLLVALGWGSVKIGLFTSEVTKALGRFTFRLLMPVMLFKLMSGFADMPPVDWRILIAFFASCAIIYAMGRSFSNTFSKRTLPQQPYLPWQASSATTCSSECQSFR